MNGEPFKLKLRIGQKTFTLEGELPTDPMRLADLLPTLFPLAETIVGAAEAEIKQKNKSVSCSKGCAACCRQLVPVSEAEAVYLSELVDSMPQDERHHINQAFQHVLDQMESQGLAPLLNIEWASSTDKEQRRQWGLNYYALNLPCPFLKDELCMIHSHRPMACREYMVTSDPRFCFTTNLKHVEGIHLPKRLSSVLYRFRHDEIVDKPMTLPLPVAWRWAKNQPATPPRYAGNILFRKVIELLAGTAID